MITVDHDAAALDRLTEQFKESTNLRALLSALISPAQSLETALQDLFADRAVDTAVDAALDAVGAIVGQARNGLADADYRRYIRARIATNNSDGLVEDLIRIARLIVYDDGTEFVVEQPGVAAVTMTLVNDTVGTSVQIAEIAVAFLREAVAAGVRLNLLYSEDPAIQSFTWDVTGRGWDDGTFFTAIV